MPKPRVFLAVTVVSTVAIALLVNREVNYAFRDSVGCSQFVERNFVREWSCRKRKEVQEIILIRSDGLEDHLHKAQTRKKLSVRYLLAGNIDRAKREYLSSVVFVARSGDLERAQKMMTFYERFLAPDCEDIRENEIFLLCGRAKLSAGEMAYLLGEIDKARQLYATGIELTRQAWDFEAAVCFSRQAYLELFVGNNCYAEELAKKSRKWLLKYVDSSTGEFYSVEEDISRVAGYLKTASEKCAVTDLASRVH